MGLFDFLKPKAPARIPEGYVYAPTQSGNIPFYSDFGDDVYASDLIVQAIQCKANEFKKLKPRHIVMKSGTKTVKTDSSIARCLRRPNEYMSTADLLEKISILLELNKNVFIYPQYYISQGREKIYTAIYPLKPSGVTYLVDKGERYFIMLEFANGYSVTLPASDIVHWRKNYGVNDFFGGGMLGGNDNKGLLKSLREYDKLVQGIAKAVECSCQINGVMKVNTYLSDEKTDAERQAFEERLAKNESGILFTDLKSDYVHMPRDIKLVDADTLKFFHETILRHTGVSLPILNGDYNKGQKEAFYEHALEPDITALGQAFSRCVFTEREDSFGNEIVFYPNNIVFMSMENKIAFAQIAAPGGYLMKDEFRELFGYEPLPDGQGQVIAQGYNNLLDENNNNKLSNE
jgi:HK97 family phage portal protein